MADFDHIAVPVDGSDSSLRAAGFAAKLGRSLNVPLKLLHVMSLTPESAMGMSRLSRDEIDTMRRHNGDAVFGRTCHALGIEPGDIECMALAGDPAEEILGYMRRNPSALVVMGRRGLSPVKTLMLGSVSEKVLRAANVAVTLVH